MISVVIPAHQEERYIGATLSALAEECRNHSCEVIVVCNGCTDRTAEIAAGFNDKINLKIIETKKKGVSFARNLGARHANGDILVFLDADIKVGKGVISKIRDAVKNGAEVGSCRAKADSDRMFDKVLMTLKSITHYFGVSTGLIFVKKELFDLVGGFDEALSMGEDGKFVRKAMKGSNYKVVDAYVLNNMRRFRQKGYTKVFLMWIVHFFSRNNDSAYEVVR